MPRQIVRHTVFAPVSYEEVSLLLRQLDWKKLEKCMGCRRLTKEIRLEVIKYACLMKAWRASPSLTEVRHKIISFGKSAQKLREFIGGSDEPISKRVLKSPKTVEAYFFGSLPRVTARPDPYIELMKKALDTVIAVSSLANSELTASRSGLSYEKWLAAWGALLRDEFRKAGLPHKVRKDTDKMSDDDQNSPFLKFYLEFLIQVGMPWQSTPSALAAALHRVFRVHRAPKKTSS
jgi:hypothetical protein